MPACISACSAATFKSNFRFERGSSYTMRLKKRNGQIRNVFNRLYFINRNPKRIYIPLIEGIIPVLKEKYF